MDDFLAWLVIAVPEFNALALMTGSGSFTDGTMASPSITFASDTNTGLRRPGADTIGFVTGGQDVAQFTSGGHLFIGSANALSGMGASRLSIQGSSLAGGTINLARFGNGVTGPAMALGKSRGSAVDTFTIVQSGDSLGGLEFWGSDGTTMVYGGRVQGYCIGTPALGDVRAGLKFETGAGGGTAATRLTISDTDIIATLPFEASNGSAAAPSYGFANSPTTGLFRAATDNIGIAHAGAETARISGSSWRIGNPAANLSGLGVRMEIAGVSQSLSSVAQFMAGASAVGPLHVLGKSRGVTVTDYTIVQVNDVLGQLDFRGSDGTALIASGAAIRGVAAGTPAAGDVRAELRFLTGSGAAAMLEALRINTAQGVLAVGNGGLGYGVGAGGAVTQITSRTTGVTLNKPAGAITMFTAAGSATPASFVVTNSAVVATDVIDLSVRSGATNIYTFQVTAVAAGSFTVTFWTTGGVVSDTPNLNYAVIKSIAS
jgi:hypothetical protein